MAKVLMTDYEKCTGCRLCELVCSVKHYGAANPSRSRIKVVKWEWEGRYVPMSCQQCLDAPCLQICPVGAISRDESLNRVAVNHDVCIGCRMCVSICPFGAMLWDVNDKQVHKCDFCHGDPQCAKFCETGAVKYMEAPNVSSEIQRTAAEKYMGILQKVAAAMSGGAAE
ncbi:MAG TPA: 4Fe-4S dicluster domain-containing protein [Dehalococcoidia bacterium]|nr:4Fe-4S dicluster domain-containing protein [Dehalococcoidia bacterium]